MIFVVFLGSDPILAPHRKSSAQPLLCEDAISLGSASQSTCHDNELLKPQQAEDISANLVAEPVQTHQDLTASSEKLLEKHVADLDAPLPPAPGTLHTTDREQNDLLTQFAWLRLRRGLLWSQGHLDLSKVHSL